MYPNGKHPMPQPEEPEEKDVEQVGAFLRRWRDPAPDPAAKANLLEVLAEELKAQRAVPLQEERILPRRRSRLGMTWAWLILRSQMRLVHPVSWVASALVIALGAVVTLALYHPSQSGAELPLVILAPIVAACGVAFLYGIDTDPALELQLATPVSPRLILLARLTLLFGFNLLITLACSIGLTLVESNISLIPLIAAWLTPMTFLSALAFLLSVLFFDSLASVLISLLLWIAIAARHFLEMGAIALSIPDLLRVDYRPALLIAAPALVVIALWIAEREERWTTGGSTH
jgi:hypothetical protein